MRRLVLISMLSILFLVMATLSWLMITESGLSTTIAVIQKWVPELSVKKVSGRLHSNVAFEKIRYQIDQDSLVTIDNLTISWQAMSLFSGRIGIDKLLIDNVVITKKSVSMKTDEAIALPNIVFPLPITVDNMSVSTVTYADKTQHSVQILSGIKAAVEFWGDNLKIKSLLLEHANNKRLKISGSVQLKEGYQTDLAYEWLLADPQRPSITADGTIIGNVTELRIEQQLHLPVASRQALTISDLLNVLNWQLEATVPQFIVADFIAEKTGQFNDIEISAHGNLSRAALKFNSKFQQDKWPNLVLTGQLESNDFEHWSVNSLAKTEEGSTLSIQGHVNALSATPLLALSGHWQQLSWPLTQPPKVILSQTGDFTLTGDKNNYALAVKGELETQKETMTFEANAIGTAQQISLTELQVQGLGGNALMTGLFNWQQGIGRYQLDANLRDITLPKELSKKAVVINTAKLGLAGTLANTVINLDSQLSVNSVPTNVTVVADVTELGATNIVLDSQIGTGKIRFTGDSTWQDQLSAKGTVQFENLNPEIMMPGWPGDLSGRWQMAVSRLGNDSVDITLQDLQVNGVLRTRPLRIMAELSYLSKQLMLPNLEIYSAKSLIKASGHIKETLALNWQVTSPDLADFYPDLTGELKAFGTLEGNSLSPVIVANISGQKIGYSDLVAMSGLASELSIDMNPQGYFKGKAALTGLNFNNAPAVNANLDLSGQKNNHQLNFNVFDKELNASGHLSGTLFNKTWQGQLTKLQLAHAKAGQWQLTKQGTITAAPDNASFKEHCLESKNGSLCLQANYAANNIWTSQGHFTSVPISLLQHFSTSLDSLQGTLDGQFQVAGKDQYPLSGKGEISLKDGRFFLADNALIEENQLVLRSAHIDYELTTTNSIANVTITPELQGVSLIAGRVMLPNLKTVMNTPDKANLSGYFKTTVDDLSVFDSLHSDYENLQGKLKADIELLGTVALPTMAGHITLDNGSVALSSLGIVLSAIKADAHGDLDAGISVNYQANSGEGHLAGKGHISFDDEGWNVSTSLKGTEVEMLNLSEAYVIASPDLMFDMNSDSAKVKGSVVIPHAALNPLRLNLPATVTVSKDVIVINEQYEQDTDSLPTNVNVNIILGDKVEIEGLGFKGRLTGHLLVTGETDKILLGAGELVIKDGHYTAYGQKLAVDGGQILFSGGALDNPNLDIKAVRKENNFSAGLQLLGPADNPQIMLFSTPTMTDDNIISHLILGRPFSEASDSDGGILAAAATGLGIKGGNMLGELIASRFGLDTVAVTGNGDDAALEIGTYLSPKLYIGYGVGMFESVNTVNLRYKLNQIWTLEAESGEETGMDILYVHEQ